MANLEKVQLPDGTTLDIRDTSALHVVGTPEDAQIPIYDEETDSVEWITIEIPQSSDVSVIQEQDETGVYARGLCIAQDNVTVTGAVTFTNKITGNPATGNLDAKSLTLEQSDVIASKTDSGGWLWSTSSSDDESSGESEADETTASPAVSDEEEPTSDESISDDTSNTETSNN